VYSFTADRPWVTTSEPASRAPMGANLQGSGINYPEPDAGGIQSTTVHKVIALVF
jgi:hypothetical protein